MTQTKKQISELFLFASFNFDGFKLETKQGIIDRMQSLVNEMGNRPRGGKAEALKMQAVLDEHKAKLAKEVEAAHHSELLDWGNQLPIDTPWTREIAREKAKMDAEELKDFREVEAMRIKNIRPKKK